MAKTRVLLVEDDGSTVDRLEFQLEEFSYEVVGAAPTNERAHALFEQTQPDVVIMDIQLRGKIDGIETAQELKKIKDVPVIFISNYTDNATVERAKTIQPFGYIPKPVNPTLLRITIELALNNHRAALSATPGENTGGKVFISYAHADKDYLEELLTHLHPLRRNGFEIWSDLEIDSGADWREEIERALNETRVGVLFLSAPFLASAFITSDELPRLLNLTSQTGRRILYIVVKPCRIPASLSRFQAINDPLKSMAEMSPAERDRVWMLVADQIEQCFS